MKTAACLFAILLTAAAVCVSLAGGAAEKHAAPLPNPMCPVLTDEPADQNIYVDWNGRRVHLCCQRCRQQFLANPAAYAANLPPLPGEAAGAAREDAHGRDRAAPRRELSRGQRLVRFAGQFHPVAVHFPIALLGVGAALELAAALAGAFARAAAARRLADGARVIVPLGAVAALLAMGLGLANAAYADFPRDLHDAVERHETLGIATATGAVIAAALGFLAARRGGAWVIVYRVALLVVALLVAGTGYLGGVLVYGPGHYTW